MKYTWDRRLGCYGNYAVLHKWHAKGEEPEKSSLNWKLTRIRLHSKKAVVTPVKDIVDLLGFCGSAISTRVTIIVILFRKMTLDVATIVCTKSNDVLMSSCSACNSHGLKHKILASWSETRIGRGDSTNVSSSRRSDCRSCKLYIKMLSQYLNRHREFRAETAVHVAKRT